MFLILKHKKTELQATDIRRYFNNTNNRSICISSLISISHQHL